MDHVAHMPVAGDPASPEVRAVVSALARRRVVVDPTLPWNELLGPLLVGTFEIVLLLGEKRVESAANFRLFDGGFFFGRGQAFVQRVLKLGQFEF